MSRRKERMMIFCGCKKHYMPDNDNQIIELDGAKWDAKCAARFLADALIKCKQNSPESGVAHKRLTALKERLSEFLCFGCNNPLGKKFEFFGNGMYCKECMHHIGGEG